MAGCGEWNSNGSYSVFLEWLVVGFDTALMWHVGLCAVLCCGCEESVLCGCLLDCLVG